MVVGLGPTVRRGEWIAFGISVRPASAGTERARDVVAGQRIVEPGIRIADDVGFTIRPLRHQAMAVVAIDAGVVVRLAVLLGVVTLQLAPAFATGTRATTEAVLHHAPAVPAARRVAT